MQLLGNMTNYDKGELMSYLLLHARRQGAKQHKDNDLSSCGTSLLESSTRSKSSTLIRSLTVSISSDESWAYVESFGSSKSMSTGTSQSRSRTMRW